MGGTRQERNAPNATASRSKKEFKQLRQRKQSEAEEIEREQHGASSAVPVMGSQFGHRPRQVVDERGMPYSQLYTGTNKSGTRYYRSSAGPWLPESKAAFKLIMSVRLCAAVWSSISDCDETFNYWEPTHFLFFDKGHQTWEYDPAYALRSYLYLLVHGLPGYLCNILFGTFLAIPNRMYILYVIRCLLALVSSLCEVYFYQGVAREVGANVGRLTLAFLVLSAGMFVSSTAFLPSTTSMFLVMLSHGAWFNQSYALAIFATALSTFLSWPFAALLGVPIALDVLFRQKKVLFFVKWCLISAGTILLPQIAIDSYLYGRLVSAPFNIVKYNLLTPHGPDLYGTEPWTFYLFNGVLNFNGAFLLALSVLPIHFLVQALVPLPERSRYFLPAWMTHLALHLWLVVFGLQSHKEERFLFPVYPLLCLAAASTLDYLQKLYFFLFVREKVRHYLDHSRWISLVILSVFGVLSLSRIFALYQNYHAPMDVWMRVAHLPQMEENKQIQQHFDYGGKSLSVCVGKEWYRYPSSFFLPDNNWDLKYIRSEFKGKTSKGHGIFFYKI